MLQLTDVRKSYTTGDFTQVALDDVSIAFRDNEFVAILGPSGSGKTTLLNIVGGLDHYDSGNLVIDGTATERYSDRDWDTYRNNRIGFVFQSYNLIPHQTVLSNVELALTLAGVSPAERRRRATQALDEVGLVEHIHKHPNQLSGGQMQRVAIARALVNDPEILLADEPTGALDSMTSVQIMALLTSIAKDRLVIMVTHNPELAETYANRIVHLRDGAVSADTHPFDPETEMEEAGRAVRRTAMSFLTAIALSFNNLMTKKGRTLMTSFAGSIGIIGIAAILALANGVNAYIKGVEEDTLSMYPLSIERRGVDLTALLASSAGLMDEMSSTAERDDEGDVHEIQMVSAMFEGVGTNDLASLKSYFDDNGGGIDDYVNSIQYAYDVTPLIYSDAGEEPRQVNPDSTFSAVGFRGPSGGFGGSAGGSDVFSELVDDLSLVDEQYDVKAGRWPSAADEVVVVLTPSGGISDYALYAMGLRDPEELDTMVRQYVDEEPVQVSDDPMTLSYDDLMGVDFRLVNATDFYSYDDQYDVWTDLSGDDDLVRELVDAGDRLRVVGVVQPTGDTSVLSTGVYYTPALTRHVMDRAAGTDIVRNQLDEPSVNVFSGRSFADDEAGDDLDLTSLITVDEDAITDAFTFDQSKLQLDLSGLDGLAMPQIDIDPSLMPDLDLASLLGDLDLGSLITLPDTPEFEFDLDQASETVTALSDGYQAYVDANGLDPADLATNFPLFIESDAGQQILTDAGLDGEPGLLVRLVGGYLDYTISNDLDLTDVAGNFPAFLETEDGQALLDEAMGLIDTGALEDQLQGAIASYMGEVMNVYMDQVGAQVAFALQDQIASSLDSAMTQLATNMSDAMSIDEDAFMSAFQMDKTQEELTQLLVSMAAVESASYEGNLSRLGYADVADPSGIDLYPIDFESKEQVIRILDEYNDAMSAQGDEDKVITYTDIVGALMGSVTEIINMVSYVLVAFVAISLVVSSIMIGVITYISVLERKKEIGILRSIGASKRDIRRVFNAETLIVGFVAGALGIAITLLLTIPANAIVYANFDVPDIAQLPWAAAGILVLVSMGLTLLAGLIPATAASHKDPVEALRSE